jgi:hypothetical protein
MTTIFTPATEIERQKILPRLQQILTARISTSALPIQFTNVTISMLNIKKKYMFFFSLDCMINYFHRKWKCNISS